MLSAVAAMTCRLLYICGHDDKAAHEQEEDSPPAVIDGERQEDRDGDGSTQHEHRLYKIVKILIHAPLLCGAKRYARRTWFFYPDEGWPSWVPYVPREGVPPKTAEFRRFFELFWGWVPLSLSPASSRGKEAPIERGTKGPTPLIHRPFCGIPPFWVGPPIGDQKCPRGPFFTSYCLHPKEAHTKTH